MARIKGMKVHSWLNYPNKGTQKCTKCKILKTQTSDGKGKTTITYHLNNGTQSDTHIECISN